MITFASKIFLAHSASKTLFTFNIADDKLEPQMNIENTKRRDIDKNDQDEARDLFSYKDREALDTLVAKVNNARDSCYSAEILPIRDFYKSSTKYDRSDWVADLVYPEKLYP